ncbi:GNAT acetyltransferase [Ruminiclostridium hungatei]|uniref:GNAT acetyltransferase n=1 Tax=Ruminiclostridium hungatei TaxID=48256 RepID=A0A1V4SJ21_RUMHU|nr:GNAT family N-acetyltransferase [Ruminiclostridium hungatei]OPX43465.1 GNAT acetyltransferase [Ruminiclostridium hungatei]
MIEVKKEEMDKIAPLFQGWDETLIWSCLQGYMGKAWARSGEKPGAAQIITGDFCFFAGQPDDELIKNIPGNFPSEYILMIPENHKWAAGIERIYKSRYERFMRYAIKKEPGVFDRKSLGCYIENLSPEYAVKSIDEKIYLKTRRESWSKDLCSQFSTYADYERYGMGFAVFHGDKLVSGASSYTVYRDGIEIEIDTREDYRRKGLALACASRLILECLDRKLYPSWDAANRESVALAEKLGYHFEKEYVTYAVPAR